MPYLCSNCGADVPGPYCSECPHCKTRLRGVIEGSQSRIDELRGRHAASRREEQRRKWLRDMPPGAPYDFNAALAEGRRQTEKAYRKKRFVWALQPFIFVLAVPMLTMLVWHREAFGSESAVYTLIAAGVCAVVMFCTFALFPASCKATSQFRVLTFCLVIPFLVLIWYEPGIEDGTWSITFYGAVRNTWLSVLSILAALYLSFRFRRYVFTFFSGGETSRAHRDDAFWVALDFLALVATLLIVLWLDHVVVLSWIYKASISPIVCIIVLLACMGLDQRRVDGGLGDGDPRNL